MFIKPFNFKWSHGLIHKHRLYRDKQLFRFNGKLHSPRELLNDHQPLPMNIRLKAMLWVLGEDMEQTVERMILFGEPR